MNIIILGAGAIGSYFGAKLSEHNDVILIGRKSHADAINKRGLKTTGIENKTYRLKAATKITRIDENTLILLATKALDSEEAINPIKNLVRKDTIILCVQNGLYVEDIVKNIIGKRCAVLRGITKIGISFLKPGAINFNTASFTVIEKSPRSLEIAANFSKCGLPSRVSENIKYEMWEKLIINCVLNPATAILKIRNWQITDNNLNPLKKSVIGECLAVAKKDGIGFDYDILEMINKELSKSDNMSSMYQDIVKCKKTEIGFLNVAVVDLGKKYGVECPVNAALASMIRYLENKKQ